jgi:transposase
MSTLTMNNLKEKVYVGIDVHKKTYSVTVLGDGIGRKTASMSASPNSLFSFLEKNYPNLEINTVYD